MRFHPIEIVFSMLIKFAAVGVLGAPALGVLIFEILLNATSMFNHSNVRILARLTVTFACSWSLPTCTVFIIRLWSGRPTATSVLVCLGGIACLEPIGTSLPPGMRV